MSSFSDKKGVLDPKGLADNPLTGAPYSPDYRIMAETWSNYPAYSASEEILSSLEENPITFIISGTGSGKTAVVPRLALHYTGYQGKVGVVLPKQIITQSAAEFTAKMLDVPMGPDIGYIYRNSDRAFRKASKLVFVTDGTIINSYLSDPLLQDYRVIILDEAHERKVQIDIILLFLKTLLASGRRPDLRVVIMSATVDYAKYRDYFMPVQMKLIQLPGEAHYPITTRFLKAPIRSYPSTMVGLILSINQKEPTDILAFITSSSEAVKLCRQVTSDDPKTYCVELYSGMDPEKKAIAQSVDAYQSLGDYHQKVVMATNVAESSITIDGLDCVIDSCYEIYSAYKPEYMANVIGKRLITKAQAIQRRGRVGRTSPGTCFHLLTQEQFDKLQNYPEPDIRSRDITQDLLRFVEISPGRSFDSAKELLNQLMDPPSKVYLKTAERLFRSTGLIDQEGSYTEKGIQIVKMANVSLDHALLLWEAFQRGVVHEASILVAFLERFLGIQEIFFRSKNCSPDISGHIRDLLDPTSDHFTILNLMKAYGKIASDEKSSWCEDRCIKVRAMESVSQESYKIQKLALRSMLPPRGDSKRDQEGGLAEESPSSLDRADRLRQALAASHSHKIMVRGTPKYLKVKIKPAISRDSLVKGADMENVVLIYDSLTGMANDRKTRWTVSTVTIL